MGFRIGVDCTLFMNFSSISLCTQHAFSFHNIFFHSFFTHYVHLVQVSFSEVVLVWHQYTDIGSDICILGHTCSSRHMRYFCFYLNVVGVRYLRKDYLLGV